MRILKYLSFFLSLAFILNACTEEVETPEISKAEAPELINPDGNSEYVFTEENKDNPFETFIYTAADYGLPIITNYTLQIATAADIDFANAVNVQEAVTVLYQTTSIEIFNKALGSAGLGLTPEEKGQVLVRVKAQPDNQGVQVLYSNAVSLTVTPYNATIPPLYVVGSACAAGWDPASGVPLESVSASGYSGIVNLIADTDDEEITFRFLPTNTGWDNGLFYNSFDTVESSPSGLVQVDVNGYGEENFKVTETGNYLIEIDLDNNGKKTVKFTKQ